MTFGPFSVPFQMDRTRNASAQVLDYLRERIVTLELEPGTALQRNELHEFFGLSSTPVRDALTRLGEEGLVDIHRQQATVVRGIDVASARQAHFLRLSLELEVVNQLAQQVTAALVATLDNLLSQQKLALAHQDFAAFVRTDMAFHRHLCAAVNAGESWDWARLQAGNLDRLRRLHLPVAGKADLVIAEHAAIIDAIAQGDGRLAMHHMRSHLSGTLSQLDAIRRRHPAWLLEDGQ